MSSIPKAHAHADLPSAEKIVPAKRLQQLQEGDNAVFSQLFDVPILWRLNRAFVPESSTVSVAIRKAVQNVMKGALTRGRRLTMTEILELVNQEVSRAIAARRDSARRLELPEIPHLVSEVLDSLDQRNRLTIARLYRRGHSSEAICREMGISASEFRALRGWLGSTYAQHHPPRTLAECGSVAAFDEEGALMDAYQALNVLRSPSAAACRAKAELRRAIARLSAAHGR